MFQISIIFLLKATNATCYILKIVTDGTSSDFHGLSPTRIVCFIMYKLHMQIYVYTAVYNTYYMYKNQGGYA